MSSKSKIGAVVMTGQQTQRERLVDMARRHAESSMARMLPEEPFRPRKNESTEDSSEAVDAAENSTKEHSSLEIVQWSYHDTPLRVHSSLPGASRLPPMTALELMAKNAGVSRQTLQEFRRIRGVSDDTFDGRRLPSVFISTGKSMDKTETETDNLTLEEISRTSACASIVPAPPSSKAVRGVAHFKSNTGQGFAKASKTDKTMKVSKATHIDECLITARDQSPETPDVMLNPNKKQKGEFFWTSENTGYWCYKHIQSRTASGSLLPEALLGPPQKVVYDLGSTESAEVRWMRAMKAAGWIEAKEKASEK